MGLGPSQGSRLKAQGQVQQLRGLGPEPFTILSPATADASSIADEDLNAWLSAGLFLLTLSTLLLETLDARLLSVLTWYHLSFLAVSLAMLGMAAGAVFVFRRPERFSPERAPAELARMTLWFACAVPVSHVVNLTVPFLPIATGSVMEVLSIARLDGVAGGSLRAVGHRR